MVFLHISETYVSQYKNGSGTIYKGISRPSGLWYGHDLSWVKYMTQEKSWSPQIRESIVPALPAYLHVFGKEKLSPPQPDDTLKPVRESPHYVYSLPIPDDAFVSPVYSGADKSKKIMKITPESLDEWLVSLQPRRKEWYETTLVANVNRLKSYGQDAPFKFLNGLKKERKAKDLQVIANDVFEGKIPGDPVIEDLFWKPVLQEAMDTWGGIDFADVFFEPGHEEYVRRFPTLRYINAGSGVLFKPVDVLGSSDATKDIKAVLSWGEPVTPSPAPNYVFGLTTSDVVRILSAPSGGKRTRRRRSKRSKKTRGRRI